MLGVGEDVAAFSLFAEHPLPYSGQLKIEYNLFHELSI